jgi:signal peptidase I
MPFGVGVSVVLTDSMKPEFSGGDVIFVTKSANYGVGDVVVFTDGRIPTVHRIIEINGDEIITKGDNNNAADQPITADRILGKVRFSVPYVGFVINVIKTPAATLVILLLAIWLMERSIRLEKAEKDKELDKIKEEIKKLKGDIN